MAEQRKGIKTGTDGYIGTRDAYETGGGGAREIQRMDFSSEHLPTTFNSSPNRSAIAAADAVDITALASTSITVGDKAGLVISCEFSVSGANCTIVPIFYDAAGTPIPMFIGDDLVFVATTLRRGAAGDYIAPARILDTMGATSIKLMVKSISSGNVDVYGGVI